MLYDDAVLLTYDVSNRFIISMFPGMKISRLMIDKMMPLKSIIFRQSGIFWWHHLETTISLIPDDAGSVGQPGKFEHLSLIKIIAWDFLAYNHLALLLSRPLRQSKLLKVRITEKFSQYILGKLTGRKPFAHVSPESSLRRETNPTNTQKSQYFD